MKLPKLILGAVIIFWGWQTGLWSFALPMALLYELSFFLNWRWHFTTAHFRQVSNLCTVFLIGVLIYLWNTDASLKLIFLLFQWLPFICFPLLIAQAYSDSHGIDIRALLFLKEKPHHKQQSITLLSLDYPFLGICLIAASAGNTRDMTFYGGVILFSSIALWLIRSPRNSAIAWISMIILAATIGFFGHVTLHNAHLSLEKKTRQWAGQFYQYHSSNPNQRSTAIGDLGVVKSSNKIILRVKPDSANLAPEKLRRATYNNYVTGMWVAVKSEFNPLELNDNRVNFLPDITSKNQKRDRNFKENRVTIYHSFKEGDNLLNLPNGKQKIANLPVEEVTKNQYGTVKVASESGLVSYQVTYNPNLINQSLPTKEDLEIPKKEFPAIQEIVRELDLTTKSEREIIETVHKFFNTQFTYSLELARQGFNPTPLSAFLLDNRAGHCEYFATATALILRAVGIPTRYTIGYSVHEYSSLEKQFIVRGKNAHAWNLVYIDGAWEELDTTPGDWRMIESQATSSWVIIRDLFSLLGFKLAQFSQLIQMLSKTKYFWLFGMPLLLILLWWLLRKRQLNNLQLSRVIKTNSDRILIGADSEIYLIEKTLNESGIIRYESESWQQWIARLETEQQLTSDLIANLKIIIRLHYGYRFDPQGITRESRAKLRSATESWLIKYQELCSQTVE